MNTQKSSKQLNAQVALTMIIKNESSIILETLDNLRENIKDLSYFCICDTGSTDDSIELIQNYLNENNLNGEIYSEKWIDFSHNRNLVMERCAANTNADYLMMWDADDRIATKEPFSINDLTIDVFQFQFQSENNLKFWRPCVFKKSLHLKYIGALHESLILNDGVHESHVRTISCAAGQFGCRSKSSTKFKDDASLLAQLFEDEQNDLLKARYAYYCATSHYSYGNLQEAIQWFNKRISLKNADIEETYWAYYHLGNTYLEKNDKTLASEVFRSGVEKFKRVDILYQASKTTGDLGDYVQSYKYALQAKEIIKKYSDTINCNQQLLDYGIDYQVAFSSEKIDFSIPNSDIATLTSILALIQKPIHSKDLSNEILRFIQSLMKLKSMHLDSLIKMNRSNLTKFLEANSSNTLLIEDLLFRINLIR